MLNVDDIVKSYTNATKMTVKELIQELWSGYGEIVRCRLEGADYSSVVIKHIKLKPNNSHPKGWNTTSSHERKVKSYEVEANWYQLYAKNISNKLRMPKLIGLIQKEEEMLFILEDLDDEGYYIRKEKATIFELKKCVSWLAIMHGDTMSIENVKLWGKGSYWHLHTRLDEYISMRESPLKDNSFKIDNTLSNTVYKCIIHGDSKLTNFCFRDDHKGVAGLDFQYTGIGCGMKDLVYLIGSALSPNECFEYEDELINFYFKELKKSTKNAIDFEGIEKEWRPLFTIAWADFNRFLLGWMPNHSKLNKYSDSITLRALEELNNY